MAEPTDRQREILEMLNEGLTAREAASELGISRNAVYQTIQRLRKNGALDPDFTPTGQPPRELMPGSQTLARLLDLDADNVETASVIALLHEIRQTRDQLSAIVFRLTSMLPR